MPSAAVPRENRPWICPQTAILVGWGAGVVPNLGVAPTIARLLDLRFPGNPVVELLRK